MIVIQLNQEAEKMKGTGRGKLFKSAANEISDLRQRVEELEAQQSEVAAHVELLVSKGRNVCEGPYNHYLYELEEALNQTPATSLNAVRLNTLMDFRHDCGSMNGYHAVDVWDKMDEYIKREFS